MNWFTDYLFLRRQIVQFKGVLSEPNPVFAGVPQGTILWPLLFLIHFNDVHKSLRYSKIITYADDSVTFTSSKDLDAIQHNLSEDINGLASWFRDNELIINLKKKKKTDRSNAIWNSKKIKRFRWQKNVTSLITSMWLSIWTPYWILIRTFTKHTRQRQEEWIYFDESVLTIYRVMIMPIFTYCGQITLGWSEKRWCQKRNLEQRSHRIILQNSKYLNWELRLSTKFNT